MKAKFALLLVLLIMFTAFTGCDSNSISTSPEASGTTQVTVQSSEPVNDGEGSDSDVGPDGSVYPLSDAIVTLTFWGPDISTNNAALPTYANLEAYDFWPYVEETTGVHLDMTIVSMTAEAEKLNIVLASGDYTDIMAVNEAQVAGGTTALLNEEIATDISAIVEEYMPNYYAYISSGEDMLKLCYNDDGKMAGTRSWAEYYVPNQGLVVRQDLLEEMKLELPNTIDELYEVLTAFKVTYDMDAPMWLGTSGQNSVSIVGAMGSAGFAGDRGSTTDHLYVQDGKVVSSLSCDSYKEYLQLMNKWYEEGLVNQDFATNTDMDASTTSILNNRTAVLNSMYGQALSLQNLLEVDNPAAQLYALATPVLNEGDVNTFFNDTPLSNTSWRIITSSCDDVELAARYIDWWYTEEGFLTANYGTKGLSYEIDGNGNPYYSDNVVNNSFGVDAGSAVEAYVTTNPVFGLIAMDRTVYLAGAQWVDDMMVIWTEQTSNRNVLPTGVSLTSEETESISTYSGDVATYATSEILLFIMGDKDFSQWDDYCGELEAMGLSKVLSVYQAAYDRYLNRQTD